MNEQLQFWGAIAGIVGLFVATLGLLRDTFNYTLEWSDSRNFLKRLIANRMFWLITVLLLLLFSAYSFYARIEFLQQKVANTDSLLQNAYMSQTATSSLLQRAYVSQTQQAATSISLKDSLNTSIPAGHILFFDDFKDNRPKNGGIEETSNISLTTSVIQGLFTAQFNTPYTKSVKIITNTQFLDFDLTIKFADITGNSVVGVTFRKFQDKWGNSFGYRFYVFPQGELKGEWDIRADPSTNANISGKHIDFSRLESIRIICKKDICRFFVNDVNHELITELGFYTIPGDIELEFTGQAIVQIDSVEIRQPE